MNCLMFKRNVNLNHAAAQDLLDDLENNESLSDYDTTGPKVSEKFADIFINMAVTKCKEKENRCTNV